MTETKEEELDRLKCELQAAKQQVALADEKKDSARQKKIKRIEAGIAFLRAAAHSDQHVSWKGDNE